MSRGKSVGGQTLREWLRDFIDTHHGPPPFDLADARTHAYNLLPRGYIPPLDSLVAGWWAQAFNGAVKSFGYGLTEAQATALAVVDPVQLSFDEIWGMSVRRLRLSKEDVEAVRADLEAWAAQNDPTLNIDATMQSLMAAAGF